MSEKKPLKKPRGKVRLLAGKCIACGARCQVACPFDAIDMNEAGEPVILLDKCTGCGKCIKICPASALEAFFTPEELAVLEQIKAQAAPVVEHVDGEAAALAAKLAPYHGIWVFVEQTEGHPHTVSWELLGKGRELAQTLRVPLAAVILGHGIEHLCQEALAYGADKVYVMDDPLLRYYRTESYLRETCRLLDKHKPEIFLIGATGLGRDLAGAVATAVGTGLTADCTGLSIDDHRNLMQTRPAFGGNIMATIMCDKFRPQMATVRPHVMPMPPHQAGRTGEIIREACATKEEEILVKVLEIAHDKNKDAVDVAAAEIVVSGGRGMMAPENFAMLKELADTIGGVVGASRSAVDAGWMPPERQVGQTGKTVRPKIYIACGISGAIQHLVGMQDSEVIIAINRDKDAPIFEVATYGIVGDVFQVVPTITRRLRELKQAKDGAKA